MASSAQLMSELEQVQSKVERFQTRRTLEAYPEVVAAREEVVQCYTYVCSLLSLFIAFVF